MAAFRELNMSANALLRLLQKIGQEQPVRIDRGHIPLSASIAGIDADLAERTIILKIFDQWKGTADPTAPIELAYSQRATATEWGPPIILNEPRRG